MNRRFKLRRTTSPLLITLLIPAISWGFAASSEARQNTAGSDASTVPSVRPDPVPVEPPDDLTGGRTGRVRRRGKTAPSPLGAGSIIKPKRPRGKGKQAPVEEPPAAAPEPTAPVVPAPKPPEDPNAPRIVKFVVTGNKKLSEEAIIAAGRHQVGDVCSTEVVNNIKLNLVNTGLFGTHSASDEEGVQVVAEEQGGKCTVKVTVDENDTVTGVNISGAGPAKLEDIKQLIHIKPGQVYNVKQFVRDATDIQDYYLRRDYVASISPDSNIDDKGQVNFIISVVRVGQIKLVKLQKTRPFVVYREMKTKMGDYYNRATFKQDRARLFNLGLFEDVLPEEQIDPASPDKVILTLSLPEKRTGTVSAGFGYSNRQQFVGRAEVSETNFRGRGQTVSLLGEIGGISGRASVDLGFTEPYLDKKKTALSVNLYDKAVYRFANTLQPTGGSVTSTGSTSDQYNEQRTGGTVSLSRPFGDRYRGVVTARGENVRTSQINLAGIDLSILQQGPIYSLATSIIHNTRDLDFDPVKGVFESLNLQVGAANLKPPKLLTGSFQNRGVFGQKQFGKASLERRMYFSLAGARKGDKLDEEKTSLAARILFGTTAGTLPFAEQYFVGGAESLRGYREDRFWGSNMVLGSIELRQPLARRFKGVLFMDLGDAWGGSYSDVRLNGFLQGGFRPHAAVGMGIRVGTPLGPIRLDLAVGEEGPRTHFSIGQAF